MAAFVEEIAFLGHRALRAANDDLAIIVVPTWGSNLLSVVHQPTGTELLRVPESAAQFLESPVLYGTPILFPPNRIEGGRFSYNGRDYQFDINEPELGNHIHGFVYNRPWDVVGAEVDDAGRPVIVTRFDARQTPEPDDASDITRQFPHHFVITMRYTLDGSTLHKAAEVRNDGAEPFPFGFGFHTTFRFPEETGRFALTAAKRWRLNDNMLPTGELEEIPFKEQLQRGMSLHGVALDDAFYVGDGATPADTGGGEADHVGAPAGPGRSAATLRYEAAGTDIHIRYEADHHFKHWVIYNADGRSGFVCPEPYTWITNAPNLNVPASVTGLQELQPGEARLFQTAIVVY